MMRQGKAIGTFLRILACAALLTAGLASGARAADTIRVGKAVPFAWTFTPVEIGIEAGTWAKNGFDVQVTSFAGDAKMQQALAADSLDFALGSGPALGFMAKGVPAKGVAAFASSPYSIALVVKYDSPFKTIADLKGKKLAVTTVGSLTDWLVKRMAIAEGWKPTDLTSVPLGGMEPFLAALKTNQVDGLMFATEVGYAMEEQKNGRILFDLAKYAPDFITHVIYARQALIDKQPELVQRFVNGWFQTIAYIKANKEKSVEIAARVLKQSPAVMSRTYDAEIKMMSDDGVFDPKALAVLKESFTEMGILETVPKDEEILTRQFVPAKQ
ncbi:MAG: nitrate/sulfonate/bicarbonate transporter substrate-binding protein [Rhodospirillales bacterium]|nr:nitrate/sulfonate/bicarbonate transporter substrate-binding protein [Rhodospirillales bacterium]